MTITDLTYSLKSETVKGSRKKPYISPCENFNRNLNEEDNKKENV